MEREPEVKKVSAKQERGSKQYIDVYDLDAYIDRNKAVLR